MPRWLLWTLFAIVSWGLWGVLSKLIGETLSPAMSQALSTLGLMPVMVAAALLGRSEADPGRRKLGKAYAFGAGVLSCVANIAYYHALKVGGKAAIVIPLTGLYPVVTVVLSIVLLGERINAVQTAGVGLSLVAICLFNVPADTVSAKESIASPWLAYALVPIVLWGVTGLLQKVSTNHVSGAASTFWFHAAFVPVGIAILSVEPLPASVTGSTWLRVTLLGLTFAAGNYGLLAAFARGGKATIITPVSGLYPLITISAAVLFLGEKISAREIAGIGTALASVLAISWERRASRGAPQFQASKGSSIT